MLMMKNVLIFIAMTMMDVFTFIAMTMMHVLIFITTTMENVFTFMAMTTTMIPSIAMAMKIGVIPVVILAMITAQRWRLLLSTSIDFATRVVVKSTFKEYDAESRILLIR